MTDGDGERIAVRRDLIRESKEGPALGVALLAATGAGIYSSVPEACKAVVKTDKVQQPEAERVPEYEKYYKLYTEIYPALKAEFAKLAKM